MMTDQYLSEIDARLKAATPGPWRACTHLQAGCRCTCGFAGEVSSKSADRQIVTFGTCDLCPKEGCGCDMIHWADERVANGQLIAHAPTDLRTLLDEVRRLRAVEDTYLKLYDAADDALGDLECAELRCWCFTRAAMRERPECACDNCKTWRRLNAATPREQPTRQRVAGE